MRKHAAHGLVRHSDNSLLDHNRHAPTRQPGSCTVGRAETCGLWHGHRADPNGAVLTKDAFAAWIAQVQKDGAAVNLPPYAPIYFPSPAVKGS